MNPRNTPPRDTKPLSEGQFIQEGKAPRGVPWWVWMFAAGAILLVVLGSTQWVQVFMQGERSKDPFLRVTNREFSLFLWQFPSYMRVNAAKKSGYLPGFAEDSENFSTITADQYVIASPELLFLYHTWSRLLASEFPARPISGAEFKEFLVRLPEWRPENWAGAPKAYGQLVNGGGLDATPNLQTLPEATLPTAVRVAFIGWKNYMKEGKEINAVQPTFGELSAFLDKYPHYARSYWRNIQEVDGKGVAGDNYLKETLKSGNAPDQKVPQDQLSPFLKVAYYNATKAAKQQ